MLGSSRASRDRVVPEIESISIADTAGADVGRDVLVARIVVVCAVDRRLPGPEHAQAVIQTLREAIETPVL